MDDSFNIDASIPAMIFRLAWCAKTNQSSVKPGGRRHITNTAFAPYENNMTRARITRVSSAGLSAAWSANVSDWSESDHFYHSARGLNWTVVTSSARFFLHIIHSHSVVHIIRLTPPP